MTSARSSRRSESRKKFGAIITSVDQSDALEIGGFAEEYDFTVKIPKAVLESARPKLNDPVQFDR